ncbi:MAG TPA: DDE-type integrase/transposase/recombinase, partial [Bacteroidota bacterium]|nr:DDE-type integrase/transposase/recombinase [Bacteroidota bacterium]
DLVTSALQRALDVRKPDAGLILHSDRGSQYTSQEVKHLAEAYGIRQSMGATGSCYDNAVTESFFHTLKTEHIYFQSYDTRQQARSSIFEYLEVFYNRQPLHSANDYTTPAEYETLFFTT